MIFPVAEHWQLYVWFTLGIIAMLAIDRVVLHRDARTVGAREAAWLTAAFVGVAVLFACVLGWYTFSATGDRELARRAVLEFTTGYLIEKVLAFDNLFVFVVVFQAFGIPPALQHRVLSIGLLSALVLRALCIGAAAWLVQFETVLVVFGVVLIATGVKTALAEERHPGTVPALRWLKRLIPVTDTLSGENFFVRSGGRLLASPLFVALVAIELSDVIFALDSIPAVLAVTTDTFLVFSSNMLALLGLRSMYFLLANAAHRFAYLRYGLGAVLVFVGLKMAVLNELWGGHFPVMISLGIIVMCIAGSIGASLAWCPGRQVAER